tara:strand:- start:800 stop:1366 length:567 start_codon:yes stop_codon:yes gene_type:complete
MYQINKDVKSEGSSTSIFPLGISENAEMTGVTVDTASNGNAFLKFSFTSEAGSNLNHFEWPIDTANEGWEKKLQSQMKRVKHILTKFMNEDKIVINATSFDDFAKTVITLLGNTYIGKKLRVKTVYSYNNYVSIPKYVPFVETMDTDPTKLNISSFDKMTKEEADNPATLTSTATGAVTEPAESGLPF